MFLNFTQKFKMATKSGRKMIFREKSAVESPNTLLIKKLVEIAISPSVSEINMFLHLTQKFKLATKSYGKMIFMSADLSVS